jgi:hypothetical protein
MHAKSAATVDNGVFTISTVDLMAALTVKY